MVWVPRGACPWQLGGLARNVGVGPHWRHAFASVLSVQTCNVYYVECMSWALNT